ncbi:MaoC family dehydratase [Pseudomonas panipatensis]|jgi:acyl dehydratase|uniref:Acyl dehydratase n=1 Tax=Pseudomonas panipatensis TaxID=428992 RepID=A0A1G8ELD9_9PSED|nr:MaoC family dehydratase [Pseudomonas panipatensis]SDH70687.1 Acyl dehydratase [Pseudomonas panipatensis]SMP68329.1 Acyl dehydratase [Pseudomonas panipatensis]
MPRVFEHPEALLACVGEELGVSAWLRVEQARIDQFAEATGDHQWIHVDPVRAASGPYGACIAHGYLTLALVNLFLPQIVEVRGLAMGVNYGCDRLRFPNVVKAGARVRGRAQLVAAEALKGAVQATIRVSVEIDGEERPGCVVDTISRYYPA